MSENAKNLILGVYSLVLKYFQLLNRNSFKRLGASCLDADEIKKQKWFEGINWKDARNKKLVPPKPILSKEYEQAIKINTRKFQNHPDIDETDKVEGWSFMDSKK